MVQLFLELPEDFIFILIQTEDTCISAAVPCDPQLLTLHLSLIFSCLCLFSLLRSSSLESPLNRCDIAARNKVSTVSLYLHQGPPSYRLSSLKRFTAMLQAKTRIRKLQRFQNSSKSLQPPLSHDLRFLDFAFSSSGSLDSTLPHAVIHRHSIHVSCDFLHLFIVHVLLCVYDNGYVCVGDYQGQLVWVGSFLLPRGFLR